MDVKSHTLLVLFICLLLIAATFSYYRIIVLKEYEVVETQESILDIPEL